MTPITRKDQTLDDLRSDNPGKPKRELSDRRVKRDRLVAFGSGSIINPKRPWCAILNGSLLPADIPAKYRSRLPEFDAEGICGSWRILRGIIRAHPPQKLPDGFDDYWIVIAPDRNAGLAIPQKDRETLGLSLYWHVGPLLDSLSAERQRESDRRLDEFTEEAESSSLWPSGREG